jgi:tRNA (guanine37-N1)-methyltransferase
LPAAPNHASELPEVMRYQVVTLFPELIESAISVGLLGKAVSAGGFELICVSPRKFATNKHLSVDDTPYGGGSGMVLSVEPIAKALDALDASRPDAPRAHRILLTPQAQRFDQACARRLAALPALTMICGRYEGFDERVRGLADEAISLGDFVLNGGEVAALAIIEATARLLPGVIGNEQSLVEESHAAGVLEYPQYTRPRQFRGQDVPEVLLSGDHARIARWRRQQALLRTRQLRPDLFAALQLTREDEQLLREHDAEHRS